MDDVARAGAVMVGGGTLAGHLTSQQQTSHHGDGSALNVVRAATLRLSLQIELAISPTVC